MLKLLSAIGQYFLLLGKVIQKPQKRQVFFFFFTFANCLTISDNIRFAIISCLRLFTS